MIGASQSLMHKNQLESGESLFTTLHTAIKDIYLAIIGRIAHGDRIQNTVDIGSAEEGETEVKNVAKFISVLDKNWTQQIVQDVVTEIFLVFKKVIAEARTIPIEILKAN